MKELKPPIRKQYSYPYIFAAGVLRVTWALGCLVLTGVSANIAIAFFKVGLSLHSLPALRNSPHYILTLKIASAIFAETLVNTKHSTRLSPQSPGYRLYGQLIVAQLKKPPDFYKTQRFINVRHPNSTYPRSVYQLLI